MKLKRTLWFSLRSSLWFVPAILVAAGAAGAVGLVAVDAYGGERLARSWPRLLTAGPEGARQVLAVIATSMMTVAGVSFSVTIVTLSLASSQYSPRVLRNFMRDRLNQTVLGTLVSVFIYCIIVMQTIHSGEPTFVPHLALWGGMLLSLLGIAGLVAFIHHTAVTIQASEIISKIAEETVDALAAVKKNSSDEAPARVSLPPQDAAWREVAAHRSGYIQDLDAPELVRRACQFNVVIDVRCSVGDFVIHGRPLLAVTPPDRISEQDLASLREPFGISTYRTIEQDPEFGVRQIVDIALKALSPSLNDSTTAVNCVDYLERILDAALTFPAAPELKGEQGRLRVMMKEPGPLRLLRIALNEIRQNARDNVAVTLRLLKLLAELLQRAPDPSVREALLHHVRLIADGTREAIPLPADREEIVRRTEQLLGNSANTSDSGS